MSIEVINQLKINSGITVKGSITESSETYDIASTQDFLGRLIDEKYNGSLAYQICEVIPLKSSFGTAYASKRNDLTGHFEVVKKDVYVNVYKNNTGFTAEVWDDMLRVFNRSSKISASNILSSISNTDENMKIIGILDIESEVKPALTIKDPDSTVDVVRRLQKKVSESIIEMNYKSYSSLDSFCILGPKWAAAILGSASILDEMHGNQLFIGRIGRTDYYVNPFPRTAGQFTNDYNYDFENEPTNAPDYAYVGIKSKEMGQSSLLFSPYMYEIQHVVDPKTADNVLFVYNRYGLSTTPLHKKTEGKGKLHKFEIISGV